MEVIVLGSGTSQGVPMIGCACPVCTSPDPRNRRTRTSIHVIMDGLHVQVDAAPEFRLQCLKEGVDTLDLFILTLGHSDHISGMDDLRRFCDLRGGEGITVHTTREGMERVAAIYPYAIMDRPIVRGYPAFKPSLMPAVMELPEGSICSTLLPHGNALTLGLVFIERSSGAKFVYYTDCKSIPDEAIALAIGAEAAILDGLRPNPHPSHMSIDEAVDAGRKIGARRVWLTHLTHLTEHAALKDSLPDGFEPAYDGLRIRL